ncbi:MAG: FtsX-like permease family protein, partial [Pseudomonadota bacterium]
MRLLAEASFRHLSQNPLQSTLGILGIALGVALFTAIQLIEQSAKRDFDSALKQLFGDATHRLVAAEGVFDERWVGTARRALADHSPAPVLEGHLTHRNDQRLHVIGFDIFARPTVRSRGPIDVAEFVTRDMVMAHPLTARTLQAQAGLAQAINNFPLDGVQVVTGPNYQWIPENTLLADLATAQTLLDKAGLISRIDLYATTDHAIDAQVVDDVFAGTARLVSNASVLSERDAITHAFFANLDALSMLALLISVFLVYNTASFLVIQRQALFGRLRAIGAAPLRLALLVFYEASLLGGAGTLIGLALGWLLANQLMSMVSQTLSDHYGYAGVVDLNFAALDLLAATVAGFLVTWIASIKPAIDAARTPP